MEYVLSGFHHESNIREFVFDGVNADRTRIRFTVGVDLSLVRKYGISLQELPLLCRHLLEGKPADVETHAFTFTEQDMLSHANNRAAALHAAEERRSHRRNPTGGGQSWRSPRPAESGT
jgi:hypothetical protein